MTNLRQFSAVFIASFKYCWRNPVAVAVLTAFPILIIFVLGNALSSYMSPDYDFEPIPVAVAVAEESGLQIFLQNEEVLKFLDLTFTDAKTALELLENDDVTIIIEEGEDGKLIVTRPRTAGMNAQIATSVADSYMQTSKAMEYAIINSSDFHEITELMQILNADISVTETPLGKRVPSAIDYYAVTMLVMILLYTGMNGIELFNKSMFSETGERMLTAPVSKPVLISGLLSATTLTSYLQGLITFLFSYFVYGVYWGERIPLVLLTLFGVTLFSQAVCIFLLLLIKNHNAAMGAAQGIFWTSTFVAGGYVKIDFGAVQQVFDYSPNSLAHTVIFGAIFGGNESKMTFDLCLLFAYTAVMFVITFLLGKRRLA
ncbi:MAG: ABC transporter permease [Oscillospiraceae bacterium]|nr:ABC transporter permease [Oscillospiraceae bacterium]